MTITGSAFTLPCGVTIPNRLAKAAMTEGLAEPGGRAGTRIARLYQAWGQGGAGLQITGNIMVDRRYRERPANIVVDGEQSAEAMAGLAAFAGAAKAGGGAVIAQISHAGRQSPKLIAPEPVGPSAIPVALPGGVFAAPRALGDDEIMDVIARFSRTAAALVSAGFDGVQVHGAHGYLISEFLSPRVNQRHDRWGGPLENRARLLIETVRAVRAAVGPDKAVSVKLNSSDFQKGGYDFADCLQVVALLAQEGVDLLEISGGNYEQPRMMGLDGLEPVFEADARESTRAREAYFMSYARQMIAASSIPVMVTGGFRTARAMTEALEDKVALIGLGRPLCVDPDAPLKLLNGEWDWLPAWENQLKMPAIFTAALPEDVRRAVQGFGVMAFFYRNILRLADGKTPKRSMNLMAALIAHQMTEAADARRI
ncbi:NADH:flavin oxidoreductase/NADH oxidase family protein [Alkalicaulis satelles]|uniref:NADH:flavin oxidoreductase/NADH oxidase family protein n=1 Tax=Alkalicaulis satelles TaxID=2609175 RepID=A0A5M6ZGC4_9PROT|nr:NADH:flavin oxidoreductase/NADH oxidase family protein [Alkalicaulis satelles]KAA5803340.1 NADH:flavin oxidoreductase/NADH oxidase family protein [Alkalicaulis satelles]